MLNRNCTKFSVYISVIHISIVVIMDKKVKIIEIIFLILFSEYFVIVQL